MDQDKSVQRNYNDCLTPYVKNCKCALMTSKHPTDVGHEMLLFKRSEDKMDTLKEDCCTAHGCGVADNKCYEY